jgi:hypothetical protein
VLTLSSCATSRPEIVILRKEFSEDQVSISCAME